MNGFEEISCSDGMDEGALKKPQIDVGDVCFEERLEEIKDVFDATNGTWADLFDLRVLAEQAERQDIVDEINAMLLRIVEKHE